MAYKFAVLMWNLRKYDWIFQQHTQYTQNQLPVDTNEGTTPKKLQKLKYLEPILGEISEKDGIQVDLLIGANCVMALEPIKVISGEAQGPYAYKTVLGWCVVGPMGVEKAYLKEMKCNNIYFHKANVSKDVWNRPDWISAAAINIIFQFQKVFLQWFKVHGVDEPRSKTCFPIFAESKVGTTKQSDNAWHHWGS